MRCVCLGYVVVGACSSWGSAVASGGESRIENLSPARGASAAEGPTVSMRDVQTRLDEKLEGVRRKEWRGKDKNGRPRTDYYDSGASSSACVVEGR